MKSETWFKPFLLSCRTKTLNLEFVFRLFFGDASFSAISHFSYCAWTRSSDGFLSADSSRRIMEISVREFHTSLFAFVCVCQHKYSERWVFVLFSLFCFFVHKAWESGRFFLFINCENRTRARASIFSPVQAAGATKRRLETLRAPLPGTEAVGDEVCARRKLPTWCSESCIYDEALNVFKHEITKKLTWDQRNLREKKKRQIFSAFFKLCKIKYHLTNWPLSDTWSVLPHAGRVVRNDPKGVSFLCPEKLTLCAAPRNLTRAGEEPGRGKTPGPVRFKSDRIIFIFWQTSNSKTLGEIL